MDLSLPANIADLYTSNSQKMRVMTERWVGNSIFCPNCGSNLHNFENNKPVADFYCQHCAEEYELKSKHGSIGSTIVDGAYSTMIMRLVANNNPNFFFLTYDRTSYKVRNFLTIPKYFFVPSIIRVRKALSPTARRAGYIGCNINMTSIPEFGKIFYVHNGVPKSRNEVLERWNRTQFVKNTGNVEAKGWLLDVLVCVEQIKQQEFSLEDVYRFEANLQSKHPLNNNVKAKIRQQLQLLRDKHVIEFVRRGRYRMKIIAK